MYVLNEQPPVTHWKILKTFLFFINITPEIFEDLLILQLYSRGVPPEYKMQVLLTNSK